MIEPLEYTLSRPPSCPTNQDHLILRQSPVGEEIAANYDLNCEFIPPRGILACSSPRVSLKRCTQITHFTSQGCR